MDYFEYMQNLRGRQDNRTRQAQITLDQIAGAGPTGAEIAVQAGQAALGNYTNLLARAQAVKAAQAAAQAEKADRAQALLDKRKEMLYGKILDRGGALPEDFGGLPAGYKLPEQKPKPTSLKTIINRRTGDVYDAMTGKVLYNVGAQPLADKLSKAAPLDYNVNIFGDQTAPAQPAAPTTFDIEG